MSNAAEQIFFYGQVTNPEHASGLDVLTYLDLTNGGTLLFQAIILITFIVILLPDLAPLTLTGAQRFIISPICCLLQSIHWVLQQLSTQESRQSFYRLCSANARDAILKSSLIQLTLVGVLWFFPSNRPLSGVCRLWALAILSKWMYISALIPGHHYWAGMTAGFSPIGRGRYEDCLAATARCGLPDRWGREQWLASYRCSGVETGLELYETLKDRAQWLVPPVDSDVRHLRLLAFMTVLIPTLVIGLWLFYTLCNKVAALRRGMVPAVVGGEPQPTECETYLWNLSKSLESANDQLQRCMDTKDAEFQAEKQRLEETVRRQTDLASRRVESALRQAKNAHAGIIDELRKKVVQLENNLTMARAEAQFVVVDEVDAAREQFLKDRIVQLEKQLAGVKKKVNARSKKELQTVRDEPQTRTDALTTLTDKLAEAETLVSAAEERGRCVEIECEKLLTQGLSSLKSELQTRTDELAAAEERLATVERKSQQGEMEHDQLKNELQARTDELANAEKQLAKAKEHSQQGKAQREQTHIHTQEFQSLKSEFQTRTDELANAKKRLAAAQKHFRQAKPEREQNLAQSQEIQSLKIELQIRTDKLAAAEKRLAAARKHSQQNEAERVAQNQKLKSLKDELQSRTDELDIWTERCLSVESRLLAADGDSQQAAIIGQQHLNQEQEQELQSLKNALQTRTDELQACADKLVDVEKHLATAEEHGRESETQRQELLTEKLELLAQNQQIIAEYEAFRVSHEANPHQSQLLETMQQELAAAIARNNALQEENNAIEIEGQIMVAKLEFDLDEAHRQLAEAQFSQVNAQQSMQEGDVAGNMSLAEARAQAEQARTQAFMKEKELAEVTEENRTLQIQVGLAMRDAQRGQERADTAERVNKVLEVRLAQWEEKARDEQTILKRPTANVGSVATALQQCQVKVSEQQTTINEFKEKLEKAKVASPAGKVEEKLRADFSMIKSMYDRERRARTEDQIRWSKENRELEEELRKLRIGISNATTQRPRRRIAGLASDPCDVD
ncbi:hypothetical protein BO82DRAFT_389603 [Aspergillus uvarum CBS 121591]|uniref:Integral membrane protein n=1 Tax=Aspergillus uvarum CBS 121591 TaxID=1448315 RepID=A0A319CGM1_9EURO|nr:hypothetical protein BO82DRAFT_389603 [Aspergillus uvarum CBS 121591]PYH84986.1 hypothetical protein BO82DRAFT_389603 [Aspergillus uvarum CBS 121591]